MPNGTRADAAYEYIRKKIIDQSYPLGSRLREDLIAEELGMSRTPVREAINRLAMVGLVVNLPHSGVFIADFSREEILDLLDLREALELVAVAKAVDRIRDDELKELEQQVEEYARACEAFDYERALELDRTFHEAIVRAAGTPRIARHFDELADLLHITRVLICQHSWTLDQTLTEHRQIVEGLIARDREIAELALRLHLSRSKARLQRAASECRAKGDAAGETAG